jgi:hypothetical protein
MMKTALQSAGQIVTKHRNRDGAAGPLTRMTHNRATTGRPAAEPGSPGWKGSVPAGGRELEAEAGAGDCPAAAERAQGEFSGVGEFAVMAQFGHDRRPAVG